MIFFFKPAQDLALWLASNFISFCTFHLCVCVCLWLLLLFSFRMQHMSSIGCCKSPGWVHAAAALEWSGHGLIIWSITFKGMTLVSRPKDPAVAFSAVASAPWIILETRAWRAEVKTEVKWRAIAPRPPTRQNSNKVLRQRAPLDHRLFVALGLWAGLHFISEKISSNHPIQQFSWNLKFITRRLWIPEGVQGDAFVWASRKQFWMS